MKEPETNNLFTELSAEESATINGGHQTCNSSRRRGYTRSSNRQHYRYYPRSRSGVSVQVRWNRRFY